MAPEGSGDTTPGAAGHWLMLRSATDASFPGLRLAPAALTPTALPCGRLAGGEGRPGRAGRARLLAAPCSALPACDAHPHGPAHGRHRLPAARPSAARGSAAANGFRGAAHVRARPGPAPPRSGAAGARLGGRPRGSGTGSCSPPHYLIAVRRGRKRASLSNSVF